MYSKIKSIKAKNFRNLGEVEVSFEASPIIALTGGNESGKTSLIKAFMVGALNSKERQQKNFIKTGTSGFTVEIELEDGTVIERSKATNRNRILIKKNGAISFVADKIDKGEGVPVELQKEMGLVIEPDTGECLHIRTYEDKLLFVTTPTSTNYKVVYDALRVDNLVRAISKGTKELNALKAQINTGTNTINILTKEIESLVTYDLSSLAKIRLRLSKELAVYEKLQKLITAKQALQKTDAQSRQLEPIKSMSTLSTEPLSLIMRLRQRMQSKTAADNACTSLSETANLKPIAETAYTKLKKLTADIKRGRALTEPKALNQALSYSEIQADTYTRLCSLRAKLSSLSELKAEQTSNADNAERLRKLFNQGTAELGIQTKVCPNCKELIIIE